MSTCAWKFLDRQTQEFLACDFVGARRDAELNAPVGCVAVSVDGNQRIEYATQEQTLEMAACSARADRDLRLAQSDWIVLRASERGELVPAAWTSYRQALRDVPLQPGFPADVKWPQAPKTHQ